MPQRKARLFRVVDLAGLREKRGLSMQDLADRMVPPVTSAFISMLEHGHANASSATLLDLARVFGSIKIEDQLGHRYLLVYQGKVPYDFMPEKEAP